MGTNINGTNNGIHQIFWDRLTSTSNTYALSQLWLVGIDKAQISRLFSFIQNNFNDYEPNWKTVDGWFSIFDNWFINDTFYLMARSVVFPGDSIEVSRTGVGQSGNIKGLIGTQRSDLPMVTITFLETNQSFADLVIRPWAILTGHMSLRETNLRIPRIELTCFQKDGFTNPLKLRKKIILQNAVPINVDNEEYNYTGDKIIDRQINFAYTKYTVEANVGNDTLSDTIVKQANDILFPPIDPNRPNDIESVVTPQTTEKTIDPIEVVNLPQTHEVIIDQIISVPQKNYLQKEPDISLLGQIQNALDTAEGIYDTVKGKVDRIKDSLGRVAALVPGKEGAKLQRAIDKTYQDVQSKVLRPVGTVIGTGQQVSHTADDVVNLGHELTTLGTPEQNKVPEANVSAPTTP